MSSWLYEASCPYGTSALVGRVVVELTGCSLYCIRQVEAIRRGSPVSRDKRGVEEELGDEMVEQLVSSLYFSARIAVLLRW